MPDLSSITFNNLYVLMKGEPGTRKSTCALSFPKPQYWFSWDLKMEALILPMKQWKIKPTDVHYDDYFDWEKARVKLEQFRLNCPYRTIIIDSITSCADAINRTTSKIKQGDNKGGMVAGIPVNSIEDYKAEESALRELIALTKDISGFHKVNIILIGHIIQKEMKTEGGQTHMARILLTAGKGIAQKMPAYCSEVYHFNITKEMDTSVGGKYALKTTHTGDDFARTSLPLKPEIIFGDNPLYEVWIEPAIQQMRPPTTSTTPTTKPPTSLTA